MVGGEDGPGLFLSLWGDTRSFRGRGGRRLGRGSKGGDGEIRKTLRGFLRNVESLRGKAPYVFGGRRLCRSEVYASICLCPQEPGIGCASVMKNWASYLCVALGFHYLCAPVSEREMNRENDLGRTLALLLLTLPICALLYFLPDTLFGYKVKKVDLLSDFKVREDKILLDSLRHQLERMDTVRVDSVALRDSLARVTGIDSAALALRDSLYQAAYAVAGADSSGARIEDYSLGHIGLKRFFAALRNRDKLGRPVRIAFLGDSFIEGDIVVADFRSEMQKAFGGRGIGFVPVTSVAAQYRPTVEQRSEGWITWSMLTDHTHGYTLPGMMFEAEKEKASLHVKTTHRYPEIQEFSSLKLIYERNEATEMRLVCDASLDNRS